MVYRSASRGKGRKPADRTRWMLRFLYVFVVAIVARLFFVQIIAHGSYRALADAQYDVTTELLPARGAILAHDRTQLDTLFPFATNETVYLAYAVPKWVEDPAETAKKLTGFLSLEESVMVQRLSKTDDLYEPLEHGVSEEAKLAVEALNLKGIVFAKETKRVYPEKSIGSHLLGFVGFSDNERKGQYGLEEFFDDQLKGRSGILRTERDAGGRWITVGDQDREPARDGDTLLLTIDRTVEYTACTKLNEAVQKHGATGGSVVILDVATGAVIGMCSYPDFDPNAYGDVKDITQFTNPATQSQYEPGSVFKPITMAGAIDAGVVTPQTQYEDPGSEVINNFTIRNSDAKTYGVQTMTQVLEQSINTGAIFAMRQTGQERFRSFVVDFGFGAKTDIELTGESAGNITPLKEKSEIFFATASFGQGITVTPLQLAAAYGAIANRGKLMKPYIIDEVLSPTGVRTKTEPQVVRQVISPETATTVTAMLVKVVQNGHGGRAGVPGYFVGGKTGTAQVPRKDRVGYDPDKTIGTFAGILPADNPRFVMVTKIDDPKDVRFAESSAAPLFGDIAKFLVNYYQIPPTVDVEL